MSVGDQDLFGTMIKVENKDIFVDLKKNGSGLFLKLSERNGKVKNTVLIPASGISRLIPVLEQVAAISAEHIKISPERKTRSADHPEVVARSVYVSGLSWETTTESIAAHFGQVGRVEKAEILFRARRGKLVSLGCAVVEFSAPEEAALARTMLATSELDGRTIRCREDRSVENSSGEQSAGAERGIPVPAAHPSPRPLPAGSKGGPNPPAGPASTSKRIPDPKRVFITSLPFETTQSDLLALMRAAGIPGVVAAEIQCTRKGRSLGHAVVEFADARSAAHAIEHLNGHAVLERAIIVRPYYTD